MPSLTQFIVWIIVGLIGGSLTGFLITWERGGFGLLRNLVVGLAGALSSAGLYSACLVSCPISTKLQFRYATSLLPSSARCLCSQHFGYGKNSGQGTGDLDCPVRSAHLATKGPHNRSLARQCPLAGVRRTSRRPNEMFADDRSTVERTSRLFDLGTSTAI
jgi:uncharacterized membrane protein YeaQ/YmgE (transglycosylase-associated protein family)